MLGSFSYNHASRKEGSKCHLENIIGTESAPRLAIGHTVDVASCKKNQHLYIGDYQLFDGQYVLSVVEKSEDPDANECNLALVYNHVSHLRNGLEFSDKHAFTTFTGSRDNSLRIGNPSARFDSTIVKFDVDETKSQVKGVWWHCLGEKPAWLPRVN